MSKIRFLSILIALLVAVPLFGMNGSNASNNKRLMALRSSGKSKAVLKAALDLSADEAEESDKEPATRAAYFCNFCKKMRHESPTKHQNHLNGHTEKKTFKCRRKGCSEHFATDSSRGRHEKNGRCSFGDKPLIDKSGELINGKLLDACQFNSLPNSNKMECPICYIALPSKSYKRHVENCRKWSGQISNNNNSNSKSGGKSKDELRTALSLNNDSEDDETISVPSNSNSNGSMSLRSSGKSKAVLKAALNLSDDSEEDEFDSVPSSSNSNSQQPVEIVSPKLNQSGGKKRLSMPQDDLNNFEQEQVLQPMLQDPNPFVPNGSMAQDDQPQNLDQLSNLFFIPGVKQPSSQALSAPDIDSDAPQQGGKSKAVLKVVLDLSDDFQGEESGSDSTQEIGKKGKLRKPMSKNMCDVLVDGKLCGRNFNSLQGLKSHMAQKHSDKMSFKCKGWEKGCKSGYYSETRLRQHEKSCFFAVSEKENFVCKNCGDQCYSQKEFKKHKKICYGRNRESLLKVKNDTANHSAMPSFGSANSSEQIFPPTEIGKTTQAAPEMLQDVDSSSIADDQEQSNFQPDSALSVGQDNGLQNFDGLENEIQTPFASEDSNDRHVSAILGSDKGVPFVHDDEMNLLHNFGHTSESSIQGLNQDQIVELSSQMMSQAAAVNNRFAPQFNNAQPAIQDYYGLFSNDDQQKIDEATQQLVARAMKRKPELEPDFNDREQAKRLKH